MALPLSFRAHHYTIALSVEILIFFQFNQIEKGHEVNVHSSRLYYVIQDNGGVTPIFSRSPLNYYFIARNFHLLFSIQ